MGLITLANIDDLVGADPTKLVYMTSLIAVLLLSTKFWSAISVRKECA